MVHVTTTREQLLNYSKLENAQTKNTDYPNNNIELDDTRLIHIVKLFHLIMININEDTEKE